jgi:hypothetical protein
MIVRSTAEHDQDAMRRKEGENPKNDRRTRIESKKAIKLFSCVVHNWEERSLVLKQQLNEKRLLHLINHHGGSFTFGTEKARQSNSPQLVSSNSLEACLGAACSLALFWVRYFEIFRLVNSDGL